MTSNLVACVEAATREPPPTLRSLGVDRVVGRRIVSWSESYGSYGMGGPGFFGVRLDQGRHPEEHLVLRLWGADGWLLYDGRWIGAHPNQYDVQRPWASDFGGDDTWDELTEVLVGGVISRVESDRAWTRFTVEREGVARDLELPEVTSRLSRFGGTMKPREWRAADHALDAWILCQEDLRV